MKKNMTSPLKRSRILMLASTLWISTGLWAQSTPVITAVKVVGPDLVGIGGSGFGSTAGTVTLGGASVTVTSWADDAIQFSAFTNETITQSLTVTTTDAVSTTSVASFVASPIGSAATDRDGSATVNTVSINSAGNQAHVSPGATFSLTFNYNTVCSGSACPIAIQLGYQAGAPSHCFYAGKDGSKTLTLTAPTAPGFYYILMDRNQNLCQAVWDYGTPPLSQSIGSISVY